MSIVSLLKILNILYEKIDWLCFLYAMECCIDDDIYKIWNIINNLNEKLLIV